MEIKEVIDKNICEDFLLSCEEKTFLQSWNWGEFEQQRNHKIRRWGFFDKEEMIAAALVIKIKAKRGTFFLIPHGPVIKKLLDQFPEKKRKILEILLKELKNIGKDEGVDFIRLSPLWERKIDNQKIFIELGFRPAPIHADYTYEATWKLNLKPREEELLMNMRKTTRYLIRQTLKNKDIIVEKSAKKEDIEIYDKLNKEVAQTHKFVPFSFDYLKNEFEVFSKDDYVLWFFGKYKEEVVAGALVIFWSGIGFYNQAASNSKYAKLSIPYLIQWEAIKEARKRGCSLYDSWGYVSPKEQPKHPWAGPTLFKMGFGGRAYEYVKTQDFPLSKKYWLTYLFEKLRKTKRSL